MIERAEREHFLAGVQGPVWTLLGVLALLACLSVYAVWLRQAFHSDTT